MWKQIGRAAISLLTLTILLGVVYPLVVTGITTLLFPYQAQGSLVYKNGQEVGSALIGQGFSAPGYFQGRPSSAGLGGYDPTGSGGSNLGPTNKILLATIAERAEKIRLDNGFPPGTMIPADIVTASGSGLDPHISPAAALLQVGRVARSRNMPEQKIQELVASHIENRDLGFMGQPRVNVLQLNLGLDAIAPPQVAAENQF
ncbi:MAG: potassium-transporting ATPase subunit KdpC [Firmicutes bacterium]|nr:potassium-transporting ATPase subunit KdpC [Bacillota bacterium]